MSNQYDIAVVGGGIAGLAAVQHALTSGCSVAHVMGMQAIGGLVCNVGELQGYPAGADPISGIDLAIGIMASNAAGGVDEIPADAISVGRHDDGFRIVHSNDELTCRQIIVATGARLRMLDVAGARELEGRGVSQCAWCDGVLYKDKSVVVIGGGDAALEEAMHLAEFASHVMIVVRGQRLTARQSYIDRVMENASVDIRFNCEVSRIDGDEAVAGVHLLDREKGSSEVMACSGVFVFVGLEPNSDLFSDLVALDGDGAIITDAALQTKTQGLYAIGAVRSGYGGRLVQAVGEAASAAVAVSRCRV